MDTGYGPRYSIDMRRVIKKIDHSISSIYGVVTLLGFLSLYLIVGNLVDHFYGPKVANSLIFNGPFYVFILSTTTLSLILSLFKRLPFKKRLSGIYLAHIGLIVAILSAIISSFTSINARVTLKPRVATNKVLLSEYQISIRERSTGVTQYIDLNFSLRPQGLNIPFGPAYLISYLPYSNQYASQTTTNGESSAVVVRESLQESANKRAEIHLSTNNLQFSNSYSVDGHQFFIFNESMLGCLENLSKANIRCVSIFRHRSIDKIKNELCKNNRYIVTNTGFVELGPSCQFGSSKLRLTINGENYFVDDYFKNTHFKVNYRYNSNLKTANTDIVKYLEEQGKSQVKFIKLGEHKDIITDRGHVYDLYFGEKELLLPFSVELDDIIQKDQANIEIAGNKKFIARYRPLYFMGWNFHLTNTSNDSIELGLVFDPAEWFKLAGFILSGIGIVIFAFQRRLR